MTVFRPRVGVGRDIVGLESRGGMEWNERCSDCAPASVDHQNSESTSAFLGICWNSTSGIRVW